MDTRACKLGMATTLPRRAVAAGLAVSDRLLDFFSHFDLSDFDDVILYDEGSGFNLG